MLTLGYLTRERRGAGFLYRIAARFLLQRPTSGTRCPTSGTEGETKKEKESRNLEEGTSPVRRAAPPLRPAGGRNPFARQPWLRKLSAYAGERLSGSQRMFAWEVIAKAEAGGLAGEEQRALDRIDREMRACGFRPST
jgi:hypothetical protein